jgi:hypothetical protein
MIMNLSFTDVIEILKERRAQNKTTYIRAGHWAPRYWLEIHTNPDHVWGIPTLIDPDTLEVIDTLKSRTEYISFDDMVTCSFWCVI